MAKNIFLDNLNNVELLNSFGIDTPLTPEQLANLSTQEVSKPEISTPVQPVIKQTFPKKDQSLTNQNVNSNSAMTKLPKEDTSSNQEADLTSPEIPLSTKQKLMQEYLQLSGKDSLEELKQARERDRMLKIGGSIGDALATYLNAQSQMNVKAPGVQVQQGAGLGKVADLFATAPEIASDIKDRREALLKQYEALAKIKKSEMSPYQQEMLSLRKEDQRLREKTLEDLNKRFGSGLEFRKSTQEFKEQEKNELSDKQVESMSSFDKVQGLSDELKIRAEQFKDKLGPYAANVEQYKSLIPGFQEDPKFAAFRASTTDTLSQYIKSLSGLTVSDKERESLLQSVPTVNDKYDIFMSKITELQKRLDRYKSAELEAAKKYQGKKIPEIKQQQPTGSIIIRLDPKSGRKVEYDATTKKPIRFVD